VACIYNAVIDAQITWTTYQSVYNHTLSFPVGAAVVCVCADDGIGASADCSVVISSVFIVYNCFVELATADTGASRISSYH